ncbi:MAG TPA: hypothetical protein VGF13_08365 [Verrucomicrobiae bacterium]
MNPQPQSTERPVAADSANVSFTPVPGPASSEPAPANPPARGVLSRAAKAAARASKLVGEKAALIARVRERLSGPPSRADGSVPTKDLEMENRLRARVLAGSDEGAARLTGDTAITIKRAWKDFGGGLLSYPRDTPPEARCPLPAPPDDSETSTDD